MNVLFLGLYMNSLIVCLCIVFFFLNGGIVLYECDYRTDIFLIFASFDQRPFQRPVASRVKWSPFCWAIQCLSHLFYFVLLFFYFFSSLFPSLLQLWKCASCSQIIHLLSGSSDIWNVSISSYYREWTQMSADMNENWSSVDLLLNPCIWACGFIISRFTQL